MLLSLVIIVFFWAHIRTQNNLTHIALIESEQRSSLILESVAEGIYGINDQGIITFTNTSACKILGYKSDQLIGKKSCDLFYFEHTEKGINCENQCFALLAIRKEKVQYSSEINFKTKQGQNISVELTASPIKSDEIFNEAVITFRDISKRKESEYKLTKIATTDALTGSFNRHKFEQIIKQEIINSKYYSKGLSIAIIDIDHFKQVNDRFGHDVGDNVLINLAKILMANIRTSDAVVRWGGEEFVIICPDTCEKSMYNLAEKLRLIVAKEKFDTIGKLSISCGVGEYHKSETQELFFKRVDKALYRAKETGRNRVLLSSTEN